MTSQHILEIFDRLSQKEGKRIFDASGEVIEVNKLTSKAGTMYERIRYLLDYKEENTIRRSALERILKRLLVIEGGGEPGKALLRELISGGYLPNKSIPESVIPHVEEIISKFSVLRDAPEFQNGELKNALLSIIASEVDDLLFPQDGQRAVIEAFYKTVRPLILSTTPISDEKLSVQVYIACERSLLKSDNQAILYTLWLRKFPEWKTLSRAETQRRELEIASALQNSLEETKSGKSWTLVPKISNFAIYFSVLLEVLERYGGDARSIVEDRDRLKQEVEEILQKKYRKENAKVRRSGNRAVAYIFCTKIILAFLLELPYDLFKVGEILYVPLFINILFHPLLLLTVTRTIPRLGAENTARVIEGLNKVLDGREAKPIRVRFKRAATFLEIVFFLLYIGIFVVTFGFIGFILTLLHFNVVSTILFLFFLTLVSYFGLRIRHNAKKWKVKTGEEGTISLLWNIFTLPIVRAGRFLSTKFASVNVVVFLMDFIIEMPFKLLLSAGDSFLNFLKEKREETY